MAGLRSPAVQLTGDRLTDEVTPEPTRALLGPVEVRALADRLGVRPTKTLGQNFVVDANTVRRIVRTAGVGPDDVVVEVGPGLGSLTLALLPVVARVVAVEIDPVLAAALPATVARHAPSYADRLAGRHRRRAAGSPTCPARRRPRWSPTCPTTSRSPCCCGCSNGCRRCAAPWSWCRPRWPTGWPRRPARASTACPSVKAAWYADVRRAGAVGRSVFWPVPNVDSGLVALDRRDPPPTTASREQVFAVVDAAFAQRRKTLRAALAGLGRAARPGPSMVLRAAGVDPRARGESLTVGDFARIAEAGAA